MKKLIVIVLTIVGVLSMAGCSDTEKTEFVYEEEIPLAVQIITSKNEVVSYQVDYFNSPEEYEKYGYEGVFAITVRFSQKTVGELDIQ